MIRRLLLRPYAFAAPWLRHSNWMIRRTAQATVLWVATVWLALRRVDVKEGDPVDPSDDLVLQLSSSTGLRDFLRGPSTVKRAVGRVCRGLLLRLSVAAKMRERSRSDHRNFGLRLSGPIDQKALRNLLLWQNHILPAYLPRDAAPQAGQADIALVLPFEADVGARLFDLFSVALMLDRIRNFALFPDPESAAASAAIVMSDKELARWHEGGPGSDLASMPGDLVRRVELHGSRGGVRLLPQGRKCANDFLKLALPGRRIIAVGLRERADGSADPRDLELWLTLIEMLRARRPDMAFVVLNCLAPSQWREWPAHLRFARHQGLTLQDALCLAQIADGYLGVLDVLGIAAHSAGRPGVYVPLEDGDSADEAVVTKAQQIMVGSRDRSRIERALEAYLAASV